MIPLKLKLSGFLSYRDPVEIDFSSFDIACISGSNGAGKSSLLDAITWALFGVARQRDDSLINAHSTIAEVTLLFGYEGNTYLIQRTKPKDKSTQLEFQILQSGNPGRGEAAVWKPLTERTLRDTQERIHDTLRMDYETFVNASFFLQGKADQFTQQRPGDRKRILGNILGLEIWEQYRQQAVERRRALEVEIKDLEGRLHEIEAELDEEAARRARLTQIESELETLTKTRQASEASLETIRQITASLASQRDFVSTLHRQLQAAEQAQGILKARIQSRCSERDELAQVLDHADEVEASYQAWQDAREELAHWDEVAGRFREQESQRTEPLLQIQEAKTRLEAERSALYSRREQVEIDRVALAGLREDILTSDRELESILSTVEERSRTEKELQESRVSQAGLEAENRGMKAEMESLKARIIQLEEVEGATCPICGGPLAPAERLSLIDQLKNEGKEMGDRYRANKDRLDDTDGKIRLLEIGMASFAGVDGDLQRKNQEDAQKKALAAGLEEKISAWESEGKPSLIALEETLKAEQYAPEARARLAEIDRELKEIGYDAATHDAVRKAEMDGRAREASHRELVRARATLAPLEREIDEIEKQLAEQENDLDRLDAEHQKAAGALAEAEARAPDQEAAEAELFRLQEDENRLRMEVGAARQKVTVLDDLKTRRNALQTEREEFISQIALHRQLERAFGKDGVPALLIEQALPQIETKANEILDRLSGGAMSVRFQTQAAFKDSRRDDLKETLDIQISDSDGSRAYEMYSGGETFRVNFAIRLALSDVLAQRAGARLQTLVIDEGFGSQDAAGRQRLIEAINQVRTDFAKILVITHIDDMREAFPNRIEVEKTGQGSRIKLV